MTSDKEICYRCGTYGKNTEWSFGQLCSTCTNVLIRCEASKEWMSTHYAQKTPSEEGANPLGGGFKN